MMIVRFKFIRMLNVRYWPLCLQLQFSFDYIRIVRMRVLCIALNDVIELPSG